MGYYLVDVICHYWATFVRTIMNLVDNKGSHFGLMQEGVRKEFFSKWGRKYVQSTRVGRVALLLPGMLSSGHIFCNFRSLSTPFVHPIR
jgi:hypothetical protein